VQIEGLGTVLFFQGTTLREINQAAVRFEFCFHLIFFFNVTLWGKFAILDSTKRRDSSRVMRVRTSNHDLLPSRETGVHKPVIRCKNKRLYTSI
jgi:hypothetical protein